MMRSRSGRAHAGQNSNVCCAESTFASQWWQRALPDSVQVFAKAPMPGEHQRHPVSQGGGRPRPTKRPSFEGRPRGPLAPARPPSCRGWHVICRTGPVEPEPQRRRPPDRPRPTDPECGGKFRDTSVPAVRTGRTRRSPPLPKWYGSPSLS